ncbi:MAG: hypothetical protein IPJ17_07770 [Holophagales bacterium]|nr:MAG: hypothetical protein IPJ17_07770 [Holophagales bacterium]
MFFERPLLKWQEAHRDRAAFAWNDLMLHKRAVVRLTLLLASPWPVLAAIAWWRLHRFDPATLAIGLLTSLFIMLVLVSATLLPQTVRLYKDRIVVVSSHGARPIRYSQIRSCHLGVRSVRGRSLRIFEVHGESDRLVLQITCPASLDETSLMNILAARQVPFWASAGPSNIAGRSWGAAFYEGDSVK